LDVEVEAKSEALGLSTECSAITGAASRTTTATAVRGDP
jgi:hypothetical protein